MFKGVKMLELHKILEAVKLLETCIDMSVPNEVNLRCPDIKNGCELIILTDTVKHHIENLNYKINGMREYIHQYRKSMGQDL
jgi:hypothetical protein